MTPAAGKHHTKQSFAITIQQLQGRKFLQWLTTVVIFWIIGWIAYLLANFSSVNFVQPQLGGYAAQLFRNLGIIPIYCLVAYYFIDLTKKQGGFIPIPPG